MKEADMAVDWSEVPPEYGHVAKDTQNKWWAYKDKETWQNERAGEPRGLCLGAMCWGGCETDILYSKVG